MRLNPAAILTITILATSASWAQTPPDCLSTVESGAKSNLPAVAEAFELRPAVVPKQVRVAEDWLFRVSPVACEGGACTVEWRTNRPDIAKWLKSAPPCGDDACAILEPVSPGNVRVTVRMCSAIEGTCRTKSLDLDIVQ